MTENPSTLRDIGTVVAAISPLLLLVFRWLDKRQDRQWKRDDELHKQRLEDLAAQTKLESAKAARKAELAAGKAENTERAVKASASQRRKQIDGLGEKVEVAIAEAKTATVEAKAAYHEANGISKKIASYGKDLKDLAQAAPAVDEPS